MENLEKDYQKILKKVEEIYNKSKLADTFGKLTIENITIAKEDVIIHVTLNKIDKGLYLPFANELLEEFSDNQVISYLLGAINQCFLSL